LLARLPINFFLNIELLLYQLVIIVLDHWLRPHALEWLVGEAPSVSIIGVGEICVEEELVDELAAIDGDVLWSEIIIVIEVTVGSDVFKKSVVDEASLESILDERRRAIVLVVSDGILHNHTLDIRCPILWFQVFESIQLRYQVRCSDATICFTSDPH